MGVIRWIEDDHTDTMGFLGKLHICTIEDMFNDHGHKWLVYKAAFPGHLPEFEPDHRFPCENEEVAREFAEGGLQDWLDEAGLTPRPKQRTSKEVDIWEYETVETARKSGTSHADRWPEGGGWEIDTTKGRVGTPRAGWERFDYHEELYFRRRVPTVGAAA